MMPNVSEVQDWRLPPAPRKGSAFQSQVGGSHYVDLPIQPVEFIHKNGLGFIEGCIVKYVARYRKKNGIEDLRKAQHYLSLLIEMEEQRLQEEIENDR